MRLLPTLLTSTLLMSAPSVSAQIIISEISFDDQWIELLNNGPTEVDMSSWSLYLATNTTNRSNNYWFAFPANSRMSGFQFLRVHWGGKIPATTPPKTELYTGDTSWHFLFGQGFEKLDREQGALAICNTQLNTQMNNPGIFSEWIQWGVGGLKRENVAVASKLWTKDAFAPKPPVGSSLSLLYFLDANPPPLSAFFLDATPTPLIHNATPLGLENLGGNCAVNKNPAINLVANGWPIHGNKEFGLTIEFTQGPAFFETMILFLNIDGKTAGWGPCTVTALGPNTIMTPQLGTAIGKTVVPLPIFEPAAKGLAVYAQALVFTPATYYSFSNRLKITISN